MLISDLDRFKIFRCPECKEVIMIEILTESGEVRKKVKVIKKPKRK